VGLANETGFPHEGKLEFVDNQLDPASGHVRMRATFDNADGRWCRACSPASSSRRQARTPSRRC
jgi:hypothetical protein